MNVAPVVLSGRLIRLEPLTPGHVGDLARAGADPDTWRWMPYGDPTTPEGMAGFIGDALAAQGRGTDLPFAVIRLDTGRAVGSTRYLDIRPPHRGLEIGGTWYAPDQRRTGVNTEAKFLLLRHAFEALGCIRVQLKTDARNEPSQRAIERIGAVREGVLRHQMILPDGHRRDTVMYSILEAEWPAVRRWFERRMALG